MCVSCMYVSYEKCKFTSIHMIGQPVTCKLSLELSSQLTNVNGNPQISPNFELTTLYKYISCYVISYHTKIDCMRVS